MNNKTANLPQSNQPESTHQLLSASAQCSSSAHIPDVEYQLTSPHLYSKFHVEEDGCSGDEDGSANKLSFGSAVAHLLVGSASPTILNLPAAFHRVGYIAGTLGSFIVVLLYAYCMHILVACETTLRTRLRRADDTRGLSYWQVLRHSLASGPPATRWAARYAKPVAYVLFACIWVGGNATYVLLMAENVKSVVKYVNAGADLSDRIVILCLAPPLVALCWLPNLAAITACSALSNTLNAASLAAILYAVLRNGWPSFEGRTAFGDVGEAPFFLGIVLITVNGTGLVLALKNEMRRPRDLSGPMGALNVAYVPTGALYAAFGLLCYAGYGADTRDTVILNLPPNLLGCLVQGLYATAVMLFYPLVTYVTYEILWTEIADDGAKGRRSARGNGPAFWSKYATKTANALLPIGLAYGVPNISVFISLIGNVCVAADSIILPAIMEMTVHWNERGLWLVVKVASMIAIGLVLAVGGLRDVYGEMLAYYLM